MLKQDWLEYFEAVNGRSATDTEIAQALLAGEFVEPEVTSTNQVGSETGSIISDSVPAQHKEELQTVNIMLSSKIVFRNRMGKLRSLSQLGNNIKSFLSNSLTKTSLLIKHNHLLNRDILINNQMVGNLTSLLLRLNLLVRKASISKLIKSIRKASLMGRISSKDHRPTTVSNSRRNQVNFLKQ